MAELMLSGCTTTTDHHYVFPAGLEDAIDIEVAAAQAARLARVADPRLDEPLAADGGLPPDSVVQDEDTILADSERVVARHHERGDGRLGADRAGAVLAVLGDHFADAGDGGAGRAARRSPAHPSRRNRGREPLLPRVYGCRPLDYLEECGWLDARTWLAHGIHFDAGEMTRLGQAGTAVTHCPCSNQILASGICPVCDMEQAGVRSAWASMARPPTTRPT